MTDAQPKINIPGGNVCFILLGAVKGKLDNGIDVDFSNFRRITLASQERETQQCCKKKHKFIYVPDHYDFPYYGNF